MAVKSKFDQSAKPQSKPKKDSKRAWWLGGIGFSFLVVIFLLYKPQATIQYGVCKVYIELNEPYPEKIKYLSLEDFGQALRVIYRRVDPFGVISVNIAECTFKVENDALTPYLQSFDVNGRQKTYESEDPKKIAEFNKSVPAIEANPPDLTVPYFPLEDMTQYRSFYNEEE